MADESSFAAKQPIRVRSEPMRNELCPCGSGLKYKNCHGKFGKNSPMKGKKNIVLIGLPGAGKSTLGVVLAKMLGYRFVDADLVIQEKCGKTLQEIIDKEGPSGFIKIESEILQSIDIDHAVISTGGSAIYTESAMSHMQALGTVVYLQISYEEMCSRLGDLDERGVVLRDSKVSSLQALYDERIPLYKRYAHVTFDVDQPSIRESALALREVLAKNGYISSTGWAGTR